jgi:hypothetical protein|tara:strand:- start:1807 stop:2106 length:300 start_codon:yes stop_codon:yes gene_type:complete
MPKYLPGQSGNLKGAPKKEWTWGSIFNEEVEKLAGDKNKSKKIKEIMARKMVDKVLNDGDTQAFKEIANRMDGLPQAHIDHSTLGKELPQPILQLPKDE